MMEFLPLAFTVVVLAFSLKERSAPEKLLEDLSFPWRNLNTLSIQIFIHKSDVKFQ